MAALALMGGEPYRYVVPWQDDVQGALEALRRDVFARGDYHGAAKRPRTIQEALARSGDTGTRSILDIERVSTVPDYQCAAPLSSGEMRRYFGGRTPTVKMVEECEDLWQDLERGMARYVTVAEGAGPKQLMFIGYSFD